ncbi:MAG: T9SS type A sorting domain-containing protein [Bacteroidales bacterium]|nr:T9SS type A sorting domain-containing protein [Bacteroidales bacterium]
MRSIRNILVIVLLSTVSNCLFAYKWQGEITKNEDRPTTRATANCEPPRVSTDLEITVYDSDGNAKVYMNNVRAKIHTGGDMWWDLQGKPSYEVPATPNGTGAHALYAGSIWIGGLDANGQLKMAAQKFRQRGIDFWPGPLITDGAERGSVSDQICREYDTHFSLTREMVTEFRSYLDCVSDPDCDQGEVFPGYSVPDEIRNWPGNGPDGGYSAVLAPYWDTNHDGYYNPDDGDFPYYEYINENITDDAECTRPKKRDRKVYGDYTLWWVYNDRGNIHTETGGSPIGMEFKAQAFGFMTNDELNDMTFYNYVITNWSTYTLYNTYFGVWTDADLGNPKDDYTGCDVVRGLGYMYNGDDDDESADGHIGYGVQPPAIGIDFFEGPYKDDSGMDEPSNWVVDPATGVKYLDCTLAEGDITNGNINGLNFGDGEANNERWGMRRFLYFNNAPDGNVNTRDPETALQHYNYITGYWLDNTSLCYGGTGHYSGGADTNVPTDFMFPGNPTTDICAWGTRGVHMPNWSEETENNPAGDRRFVQSAGPFTLKPGAINDITIGAVYARAASGGPWASVEAVQRADDKAQLLFENCFRVLNGPDAPELTIVELDRKLIFHISNKPNSNNYLEQYEEKDPSIICDTTIDPCSEFYRFQGYQVFQYRNESVSISDRYNNDKVREIFQCDIKDAVSQLVNYTWSDDLGANVPQLEVKGANNGISHTFVIEKDFFTEGALINNREYYYSAIAYGYNSSMPYNQTIQESFNGLKTPYLAGRTNIKRYTSIPHKNVADGLILQSDYGTGVEITMLEGYGNGNNIIDLTQGSIDKIMSGSPWNIHNNRVYEQGRGPVKIQIIDPLNVPEDTYHLKFVDATYLQYSGVLGVTTEALISSSNFTPFSYELYGEDNNIIRSDTELRYQELNEQLFSDKGFSIIISVDNFAAVNANSVQNGFLDASLTFENNDMQWLFFMQDEDGQTYTNWIRAGKYQNKETLGECGADASFDDAREDGFLDPNQYFGKILGGTWAPYKLVSTYRYGLALKGTTDNATKIHTTEPISSVDIVITKDTSKWTRCCVIEMGDNRWEENPSNCNRMEEVSPRVNDFSEGGALKFCLRKSPSVNKMGEPLNDGTYGRGWFPGYAIDIRTGERLNMAFGEDSWLKNENGDDMIWNPTASYYNISGPAFGGKHYIYVFGNNMAKKSSPEYDAPAYDGGEYMYNKLMEYESTNNISKLQNAWWSAMWCAVPMVDFSIAKIDSSQFNQNTADGRFKLRYDFIKTDVKIRLRVATHYTRGLSDLAIADHSNDNFPLFRFSTSDVKTIYNNREHAVKALDEIRAVPNPYYGTSDYEWEQLDNYIRITNLPRRCLISIYNTSGTLIRKLEKDNTDTFLQWDLKNSSNITVSSGIYIIHVLAYDPVDGSVVGEKVIKWFGSLRPVDLNNF